MKPTVFFIDPNETVYPGIKRSLGYEQARLLSGTVDQVMDRLAKDVDPVILIIDGDQIEENALNGLMGDKMPLLTFIFRNQQKKLTSNGNVGNWLLPKGESSYHFVSQLVRRFLKESVPNTSESSPTTETDILFNHLDIPMAITHQNGDIVKVNQQFDVLWLNPKMHALKALIQHAITTGSDGVETRVDDQWFQVRNKKIFQPDGTYHCFIQVYSSDNHFGSSSESTIAETGLNEAAKMSVVNGVVSNANSAMQFLLKATQLINQPVYRYLVADNQKRSLLSSGNSNYRLVDEFGASVNGKVVVNERSDGERILMEVEVSAEQKKIETASDSGSPEMVNRLMEIASHDLREPIRILGNYNDLILRRINAGKFDNLEQYLQYNIDAAARMEMTLDKLKRFIALQSEQLEVKHVQSDRLIEKISGTYSKDEQYEAFTLHHEGLPAVVASESELTMVFNELIRNALENRSTKVPLVIQVTGRTTSEGWQFCVRDNGMGISKEKQEAIFELFNRVKAKQQAVGLGLALCKLIVERHQGEIWVESIEGLGSSFTFTLKKNSATSETQEVPIPFIQLQQTHRNHK